ncbi:hypothetical protein [Legionella sp. W05-934-2]|uniref:hypothetical protein n=1 Tax=Legionella sp. W05-934-2 TaxID=1198649 RepID=UPI00346334A1
MNHPDLTMPQLIKLIEKKLNYKTVLNKESKNPFLVDIPASSIIKELRNRYQTEELRNRYQTELNIVFTISFVGRAFLLWAIPILLIYLIAIASVWVYRGFHVRNE